MTARRLEILLLRRELLIAQAEAQRSEVAYNASRLYAPLRVIDAAAAASHALSFYRTLALTGAALLSRRRKSALLWVSTLLTLRRLFSRRRRRR